MSYNAPGQSPDKQDYIDRQFNGMRAQLFNVVEMALADDHELGNKLKEAIKSVTGHTWNNFTREFGTREVFARGEGNRSPRDV